MKRTASFVLAASALLTGCGGGGDASGGSQTGGTTPTPSTPTTSPSSPSPANGPTTSELKPSAGTQSIAAELMLTLDAAGLTFGSNTSNQSADPVTDFALSYDTASRTYTFENDQRLRRFGPAQFREESDSQVIYEVTQAGEKDLLVFRRPLTSGSPPFVFDHVNYGAWQHNSPEGSGTRIRADYFVYGTPTLAAAVPTTGSLEYRSSGQGNLANDTDLYLVSTGITFRVDFAARTVTIITVLLGNSFLNNSGGGVGSFTVNAPLASDGTFEAPLQFASLYRLGLLKGRFFGPNAENVGFTFSAKTPQYTIAGAGIGTRQ
jgi:hypothetical protein